MAFSGTKKARLLQLLVGESRGGAEIFFVKLAIALQKRGVEQKIVILRDQERADQLRAAGCDVLELDFSKSWRDFLARRSLKKCVAEFAPDVALAWMDRAARRMPDGDFAKVGRLGGYYKLRHYRKCDHLILNTSDLRRYVIDEGWSADNARIISNFGEMPDAPHVSRASLDTPEDAFLMVALGRLHPSKGFDILIEAVATAPGTYLWIAGSGALEDELKAQANALGLGDRVKLLGWRADQGSLMRTADLCVVPSRHEPLSNVVIEAWSVETPVLAAASEGPSQLISNGDTGLLVPIDDVTAFSAAIRSLQDDPALLSSIARRGMEAWKADYSEEVICNRFITFFDEISNARHK
jgi:glycosyltransferase involved in cell wall biosynthesis